jgi:hypothetical protein
MFEHIERFCKLVLAESFARPSPKLFVEYLVCRRA